MGDVVSITDRAGHSLSTPAPAGESALPDSPATIDVEQRLHSIRSQVDALYADCQPGSEYLEALKDNAGFLGPIMQQLLECERLTRK